jgi:hypothetical protein
MVGPLLLGHVLGPYTNTNTMGLQRLGIAFLKLLSMKIIVCMSF